MSGCAFTPSWDLAAFERTSFVYPRELVSAYKVDYHRIHIPSSQPIVHTSVICAVIRYETWRMKE